MGGRGEGEEGAQQSFIWGGFARVPTPYSLFLLTPFLAEKVPLSYTFYRKYPFTCLATTGAQADGLLAKNVASRQVNARF